VIVGIKSLRRIKRVPGLSGRGRSIAGIATSLSLGPLAVALVILVALATSSTAIAGAPGYFTFVGPSGRPLAVGQPWGAVCKPVVFSMSSKTPQEIYLETRSVVTQARQDGVDVTMTNLQNRWNPNSIYPAAKSNSDVEFVPVLVSSLPQFLLNGEPAHIHFGWNASPTRDGKHEVLTYLQATLSLPSLTGNPAEIQLAIRQLIAFSQGIASSNSAGSAMTDGTAANSFSSSDLHAIQIMSGCSV